MEQYSVARSSYTPAPTNTDMAVQTSTISIARIIDVSIGGEAIAPTTNNHQLRRHSVPGVTPATLIDETQLNNRSSPPNASAFHTFTGTLPVLGGVLLNLSFDPFDENIRWVAALGEEIYLVGASGASGDKEAGLTSAIGVGIVSSHIVWEEF